MVYEKYYELKTTGFLPKSHIKLLASHLKSSLKITQRA